ncbi:putative X-Pro dipeptidase [Monocercomonoides exilis]|uniref:putative X-Pro dipeptidase n=1 Tax=Monocercomonoides exilis TaxID=2049356 RepID=UPI00355AC5AF|nr:putative X-Pro dipeptidase [Monocercomonoides exilis]|eukprot:MONOS_135.1-p1 / transcript=MONOS_135.1 / gene=MONOS_135 / organism=Monocercomonoides_exilis_PA203 / gene_product=X-Pro dipeptidase / transcript_product=X-Pro dipeptidase / location=Mono_scaffold00002:267045-269555(-) / protein_length=772 / sequence_SO=supercontig / SO=protein_coding / is_pseudo=false
MSFRGEILGRLREQIKEKGIDMLIVPSEDEHDSEYPSEADKRREFISGFTGSSGTAIVTQTNAWLLTDSRYFVQAEKQLDSSLWKLVKNRFIEDFIINELPNLDVKTIAVNGWVISYSSFKSILSCLESIKQNHSQKTGHSLTLTALNEDLIDPIWKDYGRPSYKKEPIFDYPVECAGMERFQKVLRLWGKVTSSKGYKKSRTEMEKEKLDLSKNIIEHSEGQLSKPVSQRGEFMIISALPEICWLLNIRGGDIDCVPVPRCYLILQRVNESDESTFGRKHEGVVYSAVLFTDSSFDDSIKSTSEMMSWVKVAPLIDFISKLNEISETSDFCFADLNSTSVIVHLKVESAHCRIIPFSGEVNALMKVKTEAEVANLKEVHAIDSISLIKFFYWLHTFFSKRRYESSEPPRCSFPATEYDLIEVIEYFRKIAVDLFYSEKNPNQNFGSIKHRYLYPSFEHIVAADENGAIVHYKPEPPEEVEEEEEDPNEKEKGEKKRKIMKNCSKVITENSMILFDIGGQYMGGTTDVTRTVHLSTPTPRQKRVYTLVLSSHIGLFLSRFPAPVFTPNTTCYGTRAIKLDCLARAPLWKHGMDYTHSTGHGVGSMLCVHECPPNMSGLEVLSCHQTVTVEPGLYLEGEFGVRIESLALVERTIEGVVPAVEGDMPAGMSLSEWLDEMDKKDGIYSSTPSSSSKASESEKAESQSKKKSDYDWLYLQTQTYVPYCRSLIDPSLLSLDEKRWLNAFNVECRKRMLPFLDEEEKMWLLEETKPWE